MTADAERLIAGDDDVSQRLRWLLLLMAREKQRDRCAMRAHADGLCRDAAEFYMMSRHRALPIAYASHADADAELPPAPSDMRLRHGARFCYAGQDAPLLRAARAR